MIFLEELGILSGWHVSTIGTVLVLKTRKSGFQLISANGIFVSVTKNEMTEYCLMCTLICVEATANLNFNPPKYKIFFFHMFQKNINLWNLFWYTCINLQLFLIILLSVSFRRSCCMHFGYINEHSMIIILDYGCIIEIVCFITVKIEKNDSWFCIFPCEILMACKMTCNNMYSDLLTLKWIGHAQCIHL